LLHTYSSADVLLLSKLDDSLTGGWKSCGLYPLEQAEMAGGLLVLRLHHLAGTCVSDRKTTAMAHQSTTLLGGWQDI